MFYRPALDLVDPHEGSMVSFSFSIAAPGVHAQILRNSSRGLHHIWQFCDGRLADLQRGLLPQGFAPTLFLAAGPVPENSVIFACRRSKVAYFHSSEFWDFWVAETVPASLL